ncbi:MULTISPECIES: carbohydrate ABC transporter permease [unclassified Rathayibacter]|uniref:carbohydrate ABC transporter permease n=1 Tax=unclassified Rathayibacter TaxID=2609250 RepID=UPI000F4B4750|nr:MULTISPECIES: sugar ABC transporter permease [unclassified Rathayibacter]ROP49136.1 carbohydrate ABC transporter membrane protein 1 (CUT1 family) [Rathayibacter sp. PhB186]ROS50747.1 carbohydrate ABC transporter membrane protein 1 (CUT1 family) [Rathayibacter sp. PhB185]
MSALGELGKLSKKKGGAPAASEGRHENRAAYLFLAPWLIGLVVITIGPMLASLYLSFTDYNLIQAPKFVGFDNIVEMFNDKRLANSLRVTFTYVIVSVPLQLIFALAVAMLLDRGMKGLAFYRSIFYLPSLLGSSVAIAILWRNIFGSSGLVNEILAWFGIQGPGWISNPDTALSTIIILHVWTFGAPMLIFLAGLRQIPTMYYEASSMDGATAWQRFRLITLPLLSPIIFFNLVLQIIGSFQSFTQAFIVSGGSGGPADSTMFYTMYLYQKGFAQLDMGYASAIAWGLVVIIGAFTAVNFIASKYWVFYDD